MKKRSLTWLTTVFAACVMLFATQAPAQQPDAAAQPPDRTETWCLHVTNAPNTVQAFGLDIIYPSDIMSFNEASKGELLEKGFGYFGVNELTPGRVRIGGMEPGPDNIPQGATGRLVTLTFIKRKEETPSFKIIMVRDHMQTWSVSTGEADQPGNLSLIKCTR